ncbi:MAG: hypothetical protein OEM63_10420 [Gammaproteobacteria bacterium]|nr:hypothetical protein [Gammaproteobacteria bacterium]
MGPGQVSIQDLDVEAAPGWNRVPAEEIPWARRGMQAWTRNGMSLDRLVLIPGVADGESIYLPRNNIVYPLFRADMSTPQQLALVKETIELAQGANQTEVTADNSRAHQFGRRDGILFDLRAVVHDGPEYRGTGGAFVDGDRFYLLYFLGAVPYYYEQFAAPALATIESASL